MAERTDLLEYHRLEPILWRYGGPRDFWISRRRVIEHLIETHRLEAIPEEHFVHDDPVPLGVALAEQRGSAERERVRWPLPFPGGLRIPHVHYERRVFELDKEQWAQFSQEVIKDFSAKLNAAGTVSFRQLTKLTEGMAAL